MLVPEKTLERVRQDLHLAWTLLMGSAPESALAESANPFGDPYLPSADTLGHLIDQSFWASLLAFESRYHRLSVAIRTLPAGPSPFAFVEPSQLDAKALAAHAPVVANSMNHILVCDQASSEGPRLLLWGFGTLGRDAVRITCSGPGHLVVSMGDVVVASFEQGVLVPLIVGPQHLRTLLSTTAIPRLTAVGASLLGDARSQLIRELNNKGVGGTFVFCPDYKSFEAMELHVAPSRQFRSPGASVANLIQMHGDIVLDARDPLHSIDIERQVREAATNIAYLAMVDGAVLCRLDLTVVAFGAKIRSREEPNLFTVISPLHGSTTATMAYFAGTRHASAARFAFSQPGSLVLVVSQDGPATLFIRPSLSSPLQVLERVELLLPP